MRLSHIPVNDIQNIINYLYEDEAKDAQRQKEENGDCKGHIFSSIKEVDEWLNDLIEGNL